MPAELGRAADETVHGRGGGAFVVGRLGQQEVPLAVGELKLRGAVVRVRGAVEDALVRQDELGGAEAAVAPLLGEVAQAQADATVEDTAAGALVARVEAGVVGGDVLDDRVRRDVGVGLLHGAGRGVDDGQRVAVGVVDREEVAAEQHVLAVGGDLDGAARLVDVGDERLERTGGRVHGGEPLAGLALDGGEVTGRVQGVVRDRESAHGGGEARVERCLGGAARDVDGREAGDRGSVDGAEVAARVEGLLVLRDDQRAHRRGAVADGEGQLAGGGVARRGVERDEVHGLPLGTRHTLGRTDGGEGAAGEDGAVGLGHRPDDAVRLPGRQLVGGECHRCRDGGRLRHQHQAYTGARTGQ